MAVPTTLLCLSEHFEMHMRARIPEVCWIALGVCALPCLCRIVFWTGNESLFSDTLLFCLFDLLLCSRSVWLILTASDHGPSTRADVRTATPATQTTLQVSLVLLFDESWKHPTAFPCSLER